MADRERSSFLAPVSRALGNTRTGAIILYRSLSTTLIFSTEVMTIECRPGKRASMFSHSYQCFVYSFDGSSARE